MQEKTLCIYCGSKNVRRYVYGLIRPLDKNEEINDHQSADEDRDLTIVGGCMVSDESPAYRCDDCGKDFGKFERK